MTKPKEPLYPIDFQSVVVFNESPCERIYSNSNQSCSLGLRSVQRSYLTPGKRLEGSSKLNISLPVPPSHTFRFLVVILKTPRSIKLILLIYFSYLDAKSPLNKQDWKNPTRAKIKLCLGISPKKLMFVFANEFFK